MRCQDPLPMLPFEAQHLLSTASVLALELTNPLQDARASHHLLQVQVRAVNGPSLFVRTTAVPSFATTFIQTNGSQLFQLLPKGWVDVFAIRPGHDVATDLIHKLSCPRVMLIHGEPPNLYEECRRSLHGPAAHCCPWRLVHVFEALLQVGP